MTRRGITILELLTCLGIMALVAALSYPVFSNAKESANITSSLSTMRQKFVAVSLYREDWYERDGTVEEMGFPYAYSPTSLDGALGGLSRVFSPCSRWSYVTPEGISRPNAHQFGPTYSLKWASLYHKHGHKTPMFIDYHCDFSNSSSEVIGEATTRFFSNSPHRGLAVRMDGSAARVVRHGDVSDIAFYIHDK